MNTLRQILNVALSDHTFSQKANYLNYLFAKKCETLSYDPVTISIVATSRCTLNCNMCPTHSSVVPKSYAHMQKNVKDIDFNMFKDIVDRFKRATTIHVIGSGEPLLNKDFFRMVDYAAGKKMLVKTFSNGTTIAENIDNILNSKLDGITISINGHNAAEFKRMTGMPEDTYRRIYDGVKRLVEEKRRRGSKIKVKLSFIIDAHNYRSIPKMIDTGIALGVDHIFLCNFLSSPFDGLRVEERALTADKKIVKEIRDMLDKYPIEVRKKITPPVLIDLDAQKNRCDTHFEQIRFDGDGNVSSCSMMLLNMVGNGSYKDMDVWNNSFFRKMRSAFISNDKKLLPEPCTFCPDNKGVKV